MANYYTVNLKNRPICEGFNLVEYIHKDKLTDIEYMQFAQAVGYISMNFIEYKNRKQYLCDKYLQDPDLVYLITDFYNVCELNYKHLVDEYIVSLREQERKGQLGPDNDYIEFCYNTAPIYAFESSLKFGETMIKKMIDVLRYKYKKRFTRKQAFETITKMQGLVTFLITMIEEEGVEVM